jgi:hypothetical protein
MTAGTALRSGFTRVADRPATFCAELAWRWSLGAAVFVLLLIAMAEYLDSIEVFSGHAFAGAGARFLAISAVLLAGVVLLATVAAAAGRNAVLLPLIAQSGIAEEPAAGSFRALLWLSFVRASLLLACTLAVAGAWLIAALVSSNSARGVAVPDTFGFWLVFCPLVLLIWGAWAWLYWIVSLAPLPAVAYGLAARDALARAVELIHDRPMDLGAIAIIFGVLRLGSMLIALQAAFGVFAMRSFSRAAQLALVAVIAAMYCVFSDYLFVSRMGSYAALIQNSKVEIQN